MLGFVALLNFNKDSNQFHFTWIAIKIFLLEPKPKRPFSGVKGSFYAKTHSPF